MIMVTGEAMKDLIEPLPYNKIKIILLLVKKNTFFIFCLKNQVAKFMHTNFKGFI